MPFIDLGEEFADAKEATVAPEGREFDLVCTDVAEHSKDGKAPSIRVMVRIEDPEENYAPIFHYLALPNRELDLKNDEEKGYPAGTTTRMKLLMIKRFLTAFGVPFTNTGFDPQDILGARARLALKQEVYDGRRNNRIVLPELPSEVAVASAATVNKKKSKF